MKFFNLLILVYFFEYFLIFTEATKTSTTTSTQTSSTTENGLFASFKMQSEMKNHSGVGFFSSFRKKGSSHLASNKVNSNLNIQKNMKAAGKTVKAVANNKLHKKINEDSATRLDTEDPSLLGMSTPAMGIGASGDIEVTKDISNKQKTRNLNNFNYNPVFWQGWIKFFKYNDDDAPESLTNLFKNNEFTEQMKRNPKLDLKEKDKEGDDVNVPSFKSFYGSLFKNSLTISKLSPAKGGFTKVFDVLNIAFINSCMEDTPKYIGGVEDMKPQKEGSCFKVHTKVSGSPVSWVICAENQVKKNALMEKIREIKLERQRENGILMVPQISKPPSQETLEDIEKTKVQQQVDTEKRNSYQGDMAKDGYWEVLQDWTQCNLKCGGGNSTLQRICVPPVANGKPCTGEPILIRRCNTQPCPNAIVNQYKTNSTTVNTTELKPVIKVLPFSDRPQRYEKCIVKESDLIMIMSENGHEVQVPTRAVMNNYTFSAYSGFKFTDMRKTFNLAKARIYNSLEHKNCFTIQDSDKNSATFCDFGLESTQNFYNEWSYDFNLFKYQCREKNEVVNVTFAKEMEQKLNKMKDQLKVDMITQRKADPAKEEDPLVIKHEGDVTLKALDKEIAIESMLEKEELQREEEESILLDEKVEMEKKKEDCILKAIKEREIQNQFNLRKKGQAEEVTHMREIAKRQIKVRRDYLKKRLENLKKKAEQKNELRKQQIMSIRMEVANKLTQAYRKGTGQNCVSALKNNEEWNNYCTGYFLTDASELQQCKVEKDRCNYCCEKEFGDLYIEERAVCIDKHCGPKSAIENPGRWVWKRDIQTDSDGKLV